MAQSWKGLLFAHWSVPVEALRPSVPDELPLDTFDGRAWVGVTPFEVVALRLHATLPIPFLSSFLEVNVRTYVTVDDKPGIFFFSLDSESRLAVAAARRAYRLPYFPAAMSKGVSDGWVAYESRRTQVDAPDADLSLRYRPAGEPFNPEPGSLEHWLTERYCLYTLDDERRILRGEIQHGPWRIQAADAQVRRNTMAGEIGIELSGEPLLHYAPRQDVVFWRLRPA